MKVLIVEDDKQLSLAMSMRLKSVGHSVVSSPGAIEAMSSTITNKPDVILIDINLPGGDGFTVADRLKNSTETNDTPFIFMTASKKPELREKASKAGAIGFLEKPFYPSSLLDLIETSGRYN